MTKLSERIVNEIRCKKIAPFPRWHFLLRGYFFWILFSLSVLLGSLSFSVMTHIINSGDLDLSYHLQGNLLTSAVMLLPYFWFLFLIVFAVIAYFNWKCTRRGYRFKRRWIVLVSVGLSILFGNIFYALGMAKGIDEMMARAVPFYDQSKHDARRELWFQPENGMLMGKIIDIDEIAEKLIVEDENGNSWIVADQGVTWENDKLEEKGRIVKVIGKKEKENEFVAKEIRICRDCGDDEGLNLKNEKKSNKNKTEIANLKNVDDDDIISSSDSR